MLVDQIQKGKNDNTGEPIVNVYAKNSPNYAVYQTADRVRIHYADEAARQQEQRAAIAQLNPLRSEITGLIDGWRTSKNSHVVRRAFSYSLRLSDGLIVALEEDIAGAILILGAVKQDIINERTSKARFQYLMWACLAVLFVVAVNGLSAYYLPHPASSNLWIAGSAGAIGAFFSIAIGLRSRTILTDLHYRDNASDAVLRIVIGVIAGAFIICCIQSGIASFLIDGTTFANAAGTAKQWLYVLIMGFAGGFSERLVPDMLAKSMSTANINSAALTPAIIKAAAKTTSASAASNASTSPQQVAAVAAGAALLLSANQNNQSAGPTGTVDDEADHDACLCHQAVTDDEVTADAQLPPTYGGVAAPRPTAESASV